MPFFYVLWDPRLGVDRTGKFPAGDAARRCHRNVRATRYTEGGKGNERASLGGIWSRVRNQQSRGVLGAGSEDGEVLEDQGFDDAERDAVFCLLGLVLGLDH